ncbi:bifunctional adenosylcobinamide kinase/adenosylcobinamide-phosphate guanylyltransferase [Shewanella sp.]|uniref:bifunctional adenosylcobinamide kinase/adenosylcobinamide-phosphate guanylyltransferase n=1 Tax=Shewanella sp. TaxID=50422 RepID=UPI001ED10CB6|nr:bifunctional adenosylcobinamide kinase/adenosylcobinamide-phosphate guanylyltransferase [Shewanella sp.]NRB24071.1 bifunctional adenosylcobinamide kinase/adenosylcobinamide-phosphate guanylyltransferase [Shewanella sp.]
MISLYIGGARSGKSYLAEKEIGQLQQATTYIATALNSASMQARIALHRHQRPSAWTTRETPIELSGTLRDIDCANRCIIIDCLTLWLTNQLMEEACLDTEIDRLCQTLLAMESHVVLVATEVGQSLIPLDDMSQEFVSASGEMLQKIATIADRVIFCQGALALVLKKPVLKDGTVRTVALSDRNT